MKTARFFLSIALLCIFDSDLASADTMSFYVENSATYTLQLQLFDTEDKVYWPGGGDAYDLDRRGKQSLSISCTSGHQICWGAWNKGNRNAYWGAGYRNAQSCTSCCYACVDKREINIGKLHE